MDVFNSWSDVYLTVLVTSLEVAIFLFIYKIWKVVGILRYHPAFAGFVKEANSRRKSRSIESKSGLHTLNGLLNDEEEEDTDGEDE